MHARRRIRGMSEQQVRARLYDPPGMVRRLDSKLACYRITAGPRLRGEALRQQFESRLAARSAEPAAAPAARKQARVELIV
jgi:hypothetical protein